MRKKNIVGNVTTRKQPKSCAWVGGTFVPSSAEMRFMTASAPHPLRGKGHDWGSRENNPNNKEKDSPKRGITRRWTGVALRRIRIVKEKEEASGPSGTTPMNAFQEACGSVPTTPKFDFWGSV